MKPNIASHLEHEIEKAVKTLPPSFCRPIRDPYKKQQSQYKIYEWMAFLYWYITSIASELGFNPDVVKNFALFSNIIEYTMTTPLGHIKTCTCFITKFYFFFKDLKDSMLAMIHLKSLTAGYASFSSFLFHIIFHIMALSDLAQALCKWTIGNIGHGIRSKNPPFKNIVSYTTDKQCLKMLQFYNSTLFLGPKARAQKTLLFREFPITNKKKLINKTLQAHQNKIESYAELPPNHSLKIKRFGMVIIG